MINQTSKRPTKEGQEVTGKSRKWTKTYVEHPENEPTCCKHVDRFVGSSGQHENDDDDTTITRAYAASENDEDDVTRQSFFSLNKQEMIKIISNRTHF